MRTAARKGLAGLIATVAAAATIIVAAPGGVTPAGAQQDFYTPPAPLPAGEDGDVIRSESITYSGATAERVMYRSRDINGDPMAVTGTVLVPDTPWSGPGERPVVAYAPLTAGMGDQCAVSKLVAGEMGAGLVSGAQLTFIDQLLSRGIAVAQTDYEGIGTPDDHTYVMREPQAHAVLDVLRAAQRLPGADLPADGPVGIAGYSQGGGATAAAAELAPDYAPELDIQGAYAGAVPADLSVLAESLDGSLYAAFLGFALLGIDEGYPEAGIYDLANAQGRQKLDSLDGACTLDAVFSSLFMQTSGLTANGQPVASYLSQEPFASIVEENSLGDTAPEVPMLVEHSWIDDAIPVEQAKDMARSWCDDGAQVQWRDIYSLVPFLTHLSTANTSATNAADWLTQRFNGTPATSNCGAF